jgi:hypothetical protein
VRVIEDRLARGNRPELQLTGSLPYSHKLHACIRHFDHDEASVLPFHDSAYQPRTSRRRSALL